MELGHVSIRVFLEPGEALTERLVERLCALAGFDLTGFRKEHPTGPIRSTRFSLSIDTAEGFDGPIRIVTASVLAKKDAGALFDRVVASLDDEDRAFLDRTLASRIDEEAHLFVRLDKPLFANGVFKLVDHGRCVHFDFTVLTYPRSREAAIAFVHGRIASAQNAESA